uniref:Uncharacterized protein n=1 Tax=viral metagenome TaxID=1070528 RepID=A0A6C0C434_9ZZZZ
MNDLFYYTSITLCLGSLSFCAINIFNPPLAKNIIYNTIKGYHYCNYKFKTYLKLLEYENIPMELKNNIEMKKHTKTYIGYKSSDDTTHKCNDPNNYHFQNENFDLMIVIHKNVNDEEFYRILSEKNDVETCDFDKGEVLFLQVEIEQFGKRTSIHEYLSKFYLDKNIILGKPFLEWYLKKFYSMDLMDDYKLHIIDSNVNLFTINNTQCIELSKTENEFKYLIKLI